MKYGGITPGPWEIQERIEASEIISEVVKRNGEGGTVHLDVVAKIYPTADGGSQEANAQFIADAPKLLKQRGDLLAALSEAALTIETLLSVDDDSPGRELDYNDADKVLVKIEGTLAEIKEDSNK